MTLSLATVLALALWLGQAFILMVIVGLLLAAVFIAVSKEDW